MATISVSLPSDGSTADVADYNTPVTTIVNAINGGLDNNNISASAAIAGTKLASGGVDSLQLATGVPVQTVGTDFAAVATGTTTIPFDDTIPQNTEGDQYMTQAITPKSATNILYIEATLMISSSIATNLQAALFQDSTANALAAVDHYQATATGPVVLKLTYKMVAGTTSSTTFKIRAGADGVGTTTFNGTGGNRRYGAITKSSIRITEVKV